MWLGETDHVICFSQSYGYYTLLLLCLLQSTCFRLLCRNTLFQQPCSPPSSVLIKDRTFSSLNFSFSQTNSQPLPVGLNLLFFFSGFLATSSSGLQELFNTVLILLVFSMYFAPRIFNVLAIHLYFASCCVSNCNSCNSSLHWIKWSFWNGMCPYFGGFLYWQFICVLFLFVFWMYWRSIRILFPVCV